MLRKCDVRQEGAEAAPASSVGPAIVAIRIAAVAGLVGFCFVLPLVQFAMGPSAEVAIADANKDAHGYHSYALESEYADEEGCTVYRLVSDSQPVIVKELRYRFRWFPEMKISPGMPIPSIDMPGPYYELANEDEWRQSWLEWDSEQLQQEAESGGSLRAKPRQETGPSE